jgi:hypothetical protein
MSVIQTLWNKQVVRLQKIGIQWPQRYIMLREHIHN